MSGDKRSASTAISCAVTGPVLLRTPHLNKGSAFTQQERQSFGLVGLLPSHVASLEGQAQRAMEQYRTHSTELGRNIFLASMKEQNMVLYYRLLQDHLKEMFSIIYTPTEGEAISNYSRIFRRSEGCFLDITNVDDIESSLSQWDPDDIDIIACSDGEQILGIGDQGVGAVLISIAKLVLYTLCAGINPRRTLPVVLDVGTDDETHMNDHLYLGLRQPRVRGKEYDDFIRKFLGACRRRFPKAYIHFEDFGLANARRILDEYSPQFACFNDDIQGTGAVTLAALYAAVHVADATPMQDLRVVIFGAGTAGIGIADQIRDAIMTEGGRSREEASRQIWTVDRHGLVRDGDVEHLSEAQRAYARPRSEQYVDFSLLGIIKAVKPHVLIGTSTKPKSFTEEVVREMAKHVERPIIFPLSNPTRLHEAVPSDLIEWTDGKVLTATGSPFPPVEHGGRTFVVSECNNSEIFPGIGLGAVLAEVRLMTASLLVAAVKALASQAPAVRSGKAEAGLLPDVTDVREISVKVAAAVIRQAVKDDLVQRDVPVGEEELETWIRGQMWEAQYSPLVKV